MSEQDAAAHQTTLYGAPVAERVSTVRAALGLTQGRVAEALGISAPMLSQLISGQRVKIGNPVVVDRLDQLVELAAEVTDGLAHTEVAPRLEAVRGSETTARTRRTSTLEQEAGLGRVLRAVASGRELLAAAALLEPDHPALAELLRVHGTGTPAQAREHLETLRDLL